MCVSVGLRTVTAPRVGLLTEEFIRRPIFTKKETTFLQNYIMTAPEEMEKRGKLITEGIKPREDFNTGLSNRSAGTNEQLLFLGLSFMFLVLFPLP